MANFYTMGFVGLIMEWLAAGIAEKPEVLIANLYLLIEGNFIRALHRYADKNPKGRFLAEIQIIRPLWPKNQTVPRFCPYPYAWRRTTFRT